jgi:hypothetical protein
VNKSHAIWLLRTLVVGMVIAGAVEANYRWGFRASTNEVDLRLLALDRPPRRAYRVVLFSDSMTHNPAREYRLADDVLDLTTTNGPTILGIKFMLQRIWGQGMTLENVVIFVRPEFVAWDIPSVPSSIFLWFHRPEEVKELEAWGVRGYAPIDVHLKTRVDALNVFADFMTKSRVRKGRFNPQYRLEEGIVSTRHWTLTERDIVVPPKNAELLREISELCKARGSALTVVLEPMLKVDHQRYKDSSVERLLQGLHAERMFRFVDASQIVAFKDEAFFDGVHPRTNWGKYYLLAIDRSIVKVL